MTASIIKTEDFTVCCFNDEGFGAEGYLAFPTFDPSLGPLLQVSYTVTFSGWLAYAGTGTVSYTAEVEPTFDLEGYFGNTTIGNGEFLSGTFTSTGLAWVPFSITGSTYGPVLEAPPATVQIPYYFNTFAVVNDPGFDPAWFLWNDEASLDVQYVYDPPGPTAVPEPAMGGCPSYFGDAVMEAAKSQEGGMSPLLSAVPNCVNSEVIQMTVSIRFLSLAVDESALAETFLDLKRNE